MALTSAERTGIRKGLGTIMDDEHADALVANLPDSEQLVTKDYLRAELGVLREELVGIKGELEAKINRATVSVLLAIIPAIIAGMGLAAAID